jgi:hypothetical protein
MVMVMVMVMAMVMVMVMVMEEDIVVRVSNLFPFSPYIFVFI